MGQAVPDIAGQDGAEERMCALTRTVAPRAELVRFVASPDGEVVPDLKECLPGRGMWLTLSRDAIDQAVRRKLFGRALREDVRVPDDLEDRIGQLLKRDCLATLSLAAKAGQAVAGFDKVSGLLERGSVRALVGASDGAEDGRRKLAARLRNSGEAAQLVECLASADLDLALGRTNVIHAAIMPGGLAEKFLACARRLEKFGLNGAANSAGN
jgi:predicted RNA-binding protein YlxR (DUF448 family)